MPVAVDDDDDDKKEGRTAGRKRRKKKNGDMNKWAGMGYIFGFVCVQSGVISKFHNIRLSAYCVYPEPSVFAKCNLMCNEDL